VCWLLLEETSHLVELINTSMPRLLRALARHAPQLEQLEQAGSEPDWQEVSAGLRAAAQAASGAPSSQEQRRWLLQRETALATRPCAHLGCTNMAGSSEAELKGLRCAGCATVRYCCIPCARADWPQHKPACRLMAAERAAAGGSR
jgi:hypothetical protein